MWLLCLAELSYKILDLHVKLVDFTNNKQISPLHLLANKPSAFKSGSNFDGLKKSSITEYTVKNFRLIRVSHVNKHQITIISFNLLLTAPSFNIVLQIS